MLLRVGVSSNIYYHRSGQVASVREPAVGNSVLAWGKLMSVSGLGDFVHIIMSANVA